jgi:hypothetical protein
MSNTSTVTPYDTSTPNSTSGVGIGIAAACAVGVVTGLVAAARWLAEETPEEKAMLADLQRERRREAALASPASQDLTEGLRLTEMLSVDLNLTETESLVHAAEKLGYRVEKLSNPGLNDHILLKKTTGERVALGRNNKDRIVVRTAGPKARVHALVRRHTDDRALGYLSRIGMHVQTARLANGEAQILAQPAAGASDENKAEIRAQVRADGSVLVDVEQVRGSGCMDVVEGLAQAIGGEVTSSSLKESYYELPGEPTKTRVSV